MIFCLLYSGSRAQGTLKGKIADSSSGRPLGFTTITIFKAADTSILTYRLSTPDGNFNVTGIPINLNCRVLISYSGYSVYRKEFTLTSTNPILDMGLIKLVGSTHSLDDVLVLAERPPVMIKKDTIEFNASSFKTLPNALVEDLLKKLPGVSVDTDGNIEVNGRPVNRILVDGKTFFGNDPRMASRNLPSNVIAKVQVVEDREEMMRSGDDNPNNVGKVINLTLKKDVKKGWFGKLYAGGGTTHLYEAGGIANIYRDTLQVSLLGYMNNMNRVGFNLTDFLQAGGFGRVQSNSASSSTGRFDNFNSGNSITINGINFGGVQRAYGGIAASNGAGFNLNHAPNPKRSFFLQYFNGNAHIDRITLTTFDQYKGDTVIGNRTRLTGDVVTHSHNMGTGLRLQPNDHTNILINVNYTIGSDDEDRISTVAGTNSKLGPLNNGSLEQYNDRNTYSYNHDFFITLLSKKKRGRRFNLTHTLSANKRSGNFITESDINYFYPLVYNNLYAQLIRELVPSTDAIVTFNYSDPLGKDLTFRTNGRYEYSAYKNEVGTYNRNSGSGIFDVVNNLLSNHFQRNSNRSILYSGMEYRKKDLIITPAFRLLQQGIHNRLISSNTTIAQKQFNLLPALSIVYKQLSINYSKDVTLPSFNLLNPVTNLSNPYFISKGNPDLLSSERDMISVNYLYNNPRRLININVSGSTSFADNDVVQSIVVDDKGVQTSMPVNADNSNNYSFNWNVNKQYRNKQKDIFSWNTRANIRLNRSKLLFNGLESWQTNFLFTPGVGAGVNLNDRFEWNMSYNISRSVAKNSNTYFKELIVREKFFSTDFTLRWPRHLIWETQMNYLYNDAAPAGTPKDQFRWNAALNITMLKNERGILKLAVTDLLKRANDYNITTNRNTITTTQRNFIGQYFMATFTYNIMAVGVKARVGGNDRIFRF